MISASLDASRVRRTSPQLLDGAVVSRNSSASLDVPLASLGSGCCECRCELMDLISPVVAQERAFGLAGWLGTQPERQPPDEGKWISWFHSLL